MSRKISITDTVLRDAHQSLMATRMSTEDMLPILEELDKAGYYSLEMWGGATFDACIRFLDEDPWERLRTIRKNVKNTKLQMLLRGQNILGYKHYSDEVVDLFVKKSIENGIDIIRVFDALNDHRNIETSIRSINKYGGHAQAAIVYTISPIHTIDYYVRLARQYQELGAHSIAIKDMSGILLPKVTKELVEALKANIDLDIIIHTHSTSGMAELNYIEGIRAGATRVDTAISTFAGGTSQPPTESVAMALENLGFETGLNFESLEKIAEHFATVRKKYIDNGIFDTKLLIPDVKTLIYQVPGGMLSNLLLQLKQQNNEHRFKEVLEEVPNIRKDLGYPPLVTPMSQMVGTQAVFNVILGERYKMAPTEIKDYVSGNYGSPPAPIAQEVIDSILKGMDATKSATRSYEEFKKEIGGLANTEEDVLIYALFPDSGRKFLENKWALHNKIESTLYSPENNNHPV
ncbi:MAG: pyruvate carboxylase subunit B [Peptostreptococcaceae bacterium]|nr:pyruvate carboxylase subunit B [Peptostreptococcaceae bacterium]